jgi:hypothetical protein
MTFTSSIALVIAGGLALAGVVPANSEGRKAPAVWQAPVGHRQPTARDLLPNVRRDEGTRTQSERDFDRSLQICRDC